MLSPRSKFSSLANSSVATPSVARPRDTEDHFRCNSEIYVDGVGIREVVDEGPFTGNQFDHYAGTGGCNREGGTIGDRIMTILLDPPPPE